MPPRLLYEFGSFLLDPVKRHLLREGEPVPLTRKVFETLLLLVQNGGKVLEKDEMMKILWPDTIVEEANLSQNIFTLRKTLGESPDEHKYIETIPRRGYRFVAHVTEVRDENGDPIFKGAQIVCHNRSGGKHRRRQPNWARSEPTVVSSRGRRWTTGERIENDGLSCHCWPD